MKGKWLGLLGCMIWDVRFRFGFLVGFLALWLLRALGLGSFDTVDLCTLFEQGLELYAGRSTRSLKSKRVLHS